MSTATVPAGGMFIREEAWRGPTAALLAAAAAGRWVAGKRKAEEGSSRPMDMKATTPWDDADRMLTMVSCEAAESTMWSTTRRQSLAWMATLALHRQW